MDRWDALEEKDKKGFRRIIYAHMLMDLAISMQYGALAAFALATCALAKTALAITLFPYILLIVFLCIFLWKSFRKHMAERRQALLAKVSARLETIDKK